MAVAMFCSSIVLPAFGGETMRPRWPLPMGAIEVDGARRQVLGRAVAALELQTLGRMERRQVLEQHLVARAVRGVEVDLADLQQREVALAILRRADEARRWCRRCAG